VTEKDQAVISYIGDGSSIGCSEAIIDCLCRGDKPERAVILSSEGNDKNEKEHGFFLCFEMIGWFVVSPGYASGYGGGGPTEFSKVLSLLDQIFENMFEIELDKEAFSRLTNHKLLGSDIDEMRKPIPFFGSKVSMRNYILEGDYDRAYDLSILEDYDARLPLTLIHPDLTRISLNLMADPFGSMREVCAVVEQAVRDLSGLNQSGTKLFDSALAPRVGKLRLKDCDDHGEQAGLQFLSKGFYQLHRNPLMHNSSNSLKWTTKGFVSELLIASHLLTQFSRLEENPKYGKEHKEK